VFTARYGLSPYITQTLFVFKELTYVSTVWMPANKEVEVMHKKKAVMAYLRNYPSTCRSNASRHFSQGSWSGQDPNPELKRTSITSFNDHPACLDD